MVWLSQNIEFTPEEDFYLDTYWEHYALLLHDGTGKSDAEASDQAAALVARLTDQWRLDHPDLAAISDSRRAESDAYWAGNEAAVAAAEAKHKAAMAAGLDEDYTYSQQGWPDDGSQDDLTDDTAEFERELREAGGDQPDLSPEEIALAEALFDRDYATAEHEAQQQRREATRERRHDHNRDVMEARQLWRELGEADQQNGLQP